MTPFGIAKMNWWIRNKSFDHVLNSHRQILHHHKWFLKRYCFERTPVILHSRTSNILLLDVETRFENRVFSFFRKRHGCCGGARGKVRKVRCWLGCTEPHYNPLRRLETKNGHFQKIKSTKPMRFFKNKMFFRKNKFCFGIFEKNSTTL